MYLAEPKTPRTARHPLWNIDTLKQELRSSPSTLTEILKRYSADPSKWRGAYADFRRWREQDPELMVLAEEHRIRTDSKNRTEIRGGRPRNDAPEEFADWRTKYCEALLATKSRVKAAEVTPYSYEQIYQMLNEKYASFDQNFSEMVHQTEMRLVAWAEEVIWTSLEEANTPKDRAWIAKEILKVRDRQRWGDKLDIGVSGTIAHQHMLDRGAILRQLSAEQEQAFLPAQPKQLEAVIDVEVVNERT